jgi:hypothetical protein
MSTGVCGPDGIPILKRLTAMEPELAILPAERDESPTLELSEDEEGYDADAEEDEVVEESEEKEEEDGILHKWGLVVAIVVLAYLWGVAYALSPTRSVYPSAF